MFAGIGAAEIALSEMGWQCVGYSEIDPYAINIYERHFPNHNNYGDATTINPSTLPDFDFLVGGFPCQAFSIAGSRAGFNDTRGTLFFDIARIVKEKRPKYLLLENVAGLLSHDQGRTYKTILSTLAELGYNTEALVFDSFFFDAAPRKRIYVFAVYGEQEVDVRQRIEQTIPLYLLFNKRLRLTDFAARAEEIGRSSERIIRTFAKLPDWLDGWDSIYTPETRIGQCDNSQCGTTNP